MHGLPTIEKVNKPADIRLVHTQDAWVALPLTPAGSKFIEAHYAHERSTLGGPVTDGQARMVLLNGQAEAFGVTVYKP